MGFFAFLRLSNLAPHAIASFDFTRHLTGEDIFFTKKFVKVLIKWTKTNQNRDKVQCIYFRNSEDVGSIPGTGRYIVARMTT